MSTFTIFSDKTTTGASDVDLSGRLDGKTDRTFQAFGSTTAGAGAAAINVEVSNDNTNWIVSATINLTLGTTVTTDGVAKSENWKYVRGNVTAISGTGAAISLVGNV